MNRVNLAFREPRRELLETGRGIEEYSVVELGAIKQQGDVELGFRDVDAERENVHNKDSR